ncbi:MAG: hypothetical protein ACE5M4_04335 [Anaerolineales bacterium]
MTGPKARLRSILGRIPGTAEAYQTVLADGRQPAGGYQLDRLQAVLPSWIESALTTSGQERRLPAKRVLVVGYLPWWLEYAAALSVLLASQGCKVGLGYVPYRKWTESVAAFDRRRQSAYIREAMASASRLIRLHDLSAPGELSTPPELTEHLERLSRGDVQYTFQREGPDLAPGKAAFELYELRKERNLAAASSTLGLLNDGGYEVVVIPNGSILEFGAAFQAAQWFGAKSVTYEFGEQRERMWVAQGEEVMRQNTSAFWQDRGQVELTESEYARLESMYAARRSGERGARFARQWQAAPSRGAQSAKEELGLDPTRPLALLCTNVVGDSLALNRQVFTDGMAEWLALTAKHFEDPSAGQLVVRVHPGEMLGAGHPSADIVRSALPAMPGHVIVVEPDSDINTYDLIELADVGLVYTSTVGLEMAMAGVPVVVAGETHYRGKGFTNDPSSEGEYLEIMDRLLSDRNNSRLSSEERGLATRYAYRFFFEYPFPFPWHLIGFWEDLDARPMESVIKSPGAYMETIRAMVGEPINWSAERLVHG